MTRSFSALSAGACTGLCVACGTAPPPSPAVADPPPSASSATPPPAGGRRLPVASPRGDVVDTYHGQTVADPYRWLEDDSPDVKRWTEAQNALTRRVIDAIPGRADVEKRIEQLLSVGNVDAPTPRRTPWGAWRYFYLKREGLRNQPTLYVREGLQGKDVVAFDVNTLATDGTAAIDWFYPSSDGRRIAYGVSLDGSEQSTLFVREIARNGDVKQLADEIPHTRHCSLAWKPNGDGFYYTRFPKAGEVPAGEEQYHRAVYEHTLGADPAADKKIFGDGREMTDSPAVDLSPNGRWLAIVVHQGWSKTELFLRDTTNAKGELLPVAVGKEANYTPIAANDALYILTNDGAPRGRLVKVDPRKPDPASWKDVIPENEHTLDNVTLVGRQLIAAYVRDASSLLRRHDLDGKSLGEVELPVLGTAWVQAAHDGREAFVGFTSFAVKSDVYRVALTGAAKPELWQRVETPIDADSVVVDQFFATSKDGTRVPYFVVRRSDVALDGTAPAVITAYGGFNISVVPEFLRGAAVVLERGGVFVQANLRGGGEYGEAWHKAGMLDRKQNVFDDMYAVIEDVKARKVAAPDRVGIAGGSNGGLLVGAMLVQHPTLFRVAVARVPLMDMLRYQHFLIAKLWIPEYGEAQDPALFPTLRSYSPYHNVEESVAYPATLMTAAESDSRVHTLHARKMTAALQWATSSDEPILARLESKAGHGAGKPITKQVEEYADVYSFMMWKLGMMK